MKTRFQIVVFCIFFGLLMISSPNRLVNADTSHCGTISSNETWSNSGNVHQITCDVVVASGVTLTIQAGTIIKFNNYTRLTIEGTLRVLGTSGNPVYFTSISDDTIGGDTNGNGASNGIPGIWYDIRFTDTSDDANSIIDYAIIRYGGDSFSGNYSGSISLISASPTIQNTTIVQSQYCAIYGDMDAYPNLTNNTFQDNERNAFCLSGGTIDIDATWDNTDISYMLMGDVTVFIGNTLTINPGVVVKSKYQRLTVNGSLRVLGTSGNPVYFTSYRDDTIGGDTDNGASIGYPGDWYDIRFTDTSDDANSIIDHAVIRYGGDSFSGNYSGGISLFNASTQIQNSTITTNQYAGIYLSNSQPELNCNNILNNSNYGIINSSPSLIIDADNIWWGSDKGPYHPNLNPAGEGNRVSDGVDFTPWLAASCINPSEFQIDLDVLNSAILLQYDSNSNLFNNKKYQPNQIVLKADVSNNGTENANDVTLKIWDGHPSSGHTLSVLQNLTVNSGQTIAVPIELIVTESVKQAKLYLEVISGISQPDQNISNNVSSVGTSAYIAFADYKFIPDTFSFRNWQMTGTDFFRVFGIYPLEETPAPIFSIWYNIVGSTIYYKYAKSGHCGGMSQSSVIYWDTPSEKPVDIPTYDMLKLDVIDDIQDQQVRQLIYIESQGILKKINPTIFSPTSAYNHVKNALSRPNPEPSILHFWGCCDTTGKKINHIVVAYKIVEINGEKNIYIYDNQDELSNIFNGEPANILTLDLDKDEFNYIHGALDAALTEAYAYAPIRNASEITNEMIEDIIDATLKSLHKEDLFQLFFNWNPFSLTGVNSENGIAAPVNFYVETISGHKTGIFNGSPINDIPGAVFQEWESSYYFNLPAGLEYKAIMNGNGLTSNTLSLTVPKPGYTVEALIFDEFEIPDGITGALDIHRDSEDWRIKFIDATQDITPTTDELFEFREYIYLPFTRNK